MLVGLVIVKANESISYRVCFVNLFYDFITIKVYHNKSLFL